MSYFKLFVARELCILHLMSEIDIKLLIIEIEKRFLDIKIILSNLFEINKISIRERGGGGRKRIISPKVISGIQLFYNEYLFIY